MRPFRPYRRNTLIRRQSPKPHQIRGQKRACPPVSTSAVHKNSSVIHQAAVGGKQAEEGVEIVDGGAVEVFYRYDGPC